MPTIPLRAKQDGAAARRSRTEPDASNAARDSGNTRYEWLFAPERSPIPARREAKIRDRGINLR